MFHTVVTLICNPAAPRLGNELAGRLTCHLDHLGFGASRRKALAAGIAEDIFFHESIEPDELCAIVKKFFSDVPIDVVAQSVAHRRKRLLIADMDSTIIEQECIDELADFAGKREEIAAITERAMRGELDFEAALKERVAMLKGLPGTVLEETFRERITLTPGARTLVRTMNKAGATTALVSGGFTFFAERVAEACGFQHVQANELLVANDVLTGKVAEPILGRDAKERALRSLAAENGIDLAETLAVGDGANDLAMLDAAGLGVAFRAKPAVAAAADAAVNHGDLTALLYLQGHQRDEFVVG